MKSFHACFCGICHHPAQKCAHQPGSSPRPRCLGFFNGVVHYCCAKIDLVICHFIESNLQRLSSPPCGWDGAEFQSPIIWPALSVASPSLEISKCPPCHLICMCSGLVKGAHYDEQNTPNAFGHFRDPMCQELEPEVPHTLLRCHSWPCKRQPSVIFSTLLTSLYCVSRLTRLTIWSQ